MGRRTDVILAVLGFAQLVDQRLDAVGGGAEETEAAEVAHLFSFDVVDAIG